VIGVGGRHVSEKNPLRRGEGAISLISGEVQYVIHSSPQRGKRRVGLKEKVWGRKRLLN